MMNGHPFPASSTRQGATILIVEDDAAAVEIFEQILTAKGYDVRVAADARQALIEVQRQTPSAVLVDLHMPLMDGLEFLRRVRADIPDAHMPIALVTGDYFLQDEMAQEVRALGARVHFKPLWDDDLLKLVQDLLNTNQVGDVHGHCTDRR